MLADYERFPRTVEVMDYRGEGDVYTMELARYRFGGTFGSAWTSILGEAPTDWGRRVKDVYPLRDFLEGEVPGGREGAVLRRAAPGGLLGADVAGPGRAERAGAGPGERQDRVPGGHRGGVSPGGGEAGSRSEGDVLKDGLGAAAVLGLCQVGGEKLCAGAATKAQKLAAAAPVAVEPAPSSVVPAAAKAPKPGKKVPAKKPARRH